MVLDPTVQFEYTLLAICLWILLTCFNTAYSGARVSPEALVMYNVLYWLDQHNTVLQPHVCFINNNY